jgi:antitoxin (DNA-binding transcriptional repressor) of toxin-antitoxin stability system
MRGGASQPPFDTIFKMNHYDSPMESVTVRDLRTSFPKIEKILASGQSVEIRKRNRVIGVLAPPPERKKIKMPDFEARLRKIFPKGCKGGDSIVEALIRDRDES